MHNTHNKISMPVAIIIAGFFIMIGLVITRNGDGKTLTKTPSEQVGISKDKLALCIKNTDTEALQKSIDASVQAAMKDVPANRRGTPYSVIIGPNNFKTDIRGAATAEQVKLIVAAAKEGKLAENPQTLGVGKKAQPTTITALYTGDIALSEPTDHVFGNPNAKITIIEYSDFECPYCKIFHPTLKQVVTDSQGDVKWIYRNWPLHQHSVEKLVAAECVAKIKGNDTYWKYADLLFGMLKTGSDSVEGTL